MADTSERFPKINLDDPNDPINHDTYHATREGVLPHGWTKNMRVPGGHTTYISPEGITYRNSFKKSLQLNALKNNLEYYGCKQVQKTAKKTGSIYTCFVEINTGREFFSMNSLFSYLLGIGKYDMQQGKVNVSQAKRTFGNKEKELVNDCKNPYISDKKNQKSKKKPSKSNDKNNSQTVKSKKKAWEINFDDGANSIKKIANSDEIYDISMETMEISYTCDICYKELQSLDDLDIHIYMHSEKTHSCNVCNRDFISLDVLTIHNFNHSGEIYSCVICNEDFQNVEDFNTHTNLHFTKNSFSTLNDEDPAFIQINTENADEFIKQEIE